MAKQAVWIGIAIGVFFAGLGIGYAIFSATNPTVSQRQHMMAQIMSDPQAMTDWMNQMMVNPQAMQKMHEAMINNPDHMKKMHEFMMNNPEHMKQMHEIMMKNPEHMQQMMGQMMMDPATMQQMHQMMFQDPQHMKQMMTMMGNTTMMGAGPMSNSGMMGPMMMGTPITKESDILKTIDRIEDLLDQVSIKYNDGNSIDALSAATEAYLENYEYIEGAIASKDPHLMEKVEVMLRQDLRHAIDTDQSAEKIDSKIDLIKQELSNIRNLFQ